jgi:ubiquinol-cytochrome c reductase iron-sulfur subunit
MAEREELRVAGKTEAPQERQAATGVDSTTRCDFLTLMTASFAAVGLGVTIWPFVSSMNPARDVLALSTTEVNLLPAAAGQAFTVIWRGKPVFLRHRTPQEILAARSVNVSELINSQTDAARVIKPEWLVVIGACARISAAFCWGRRSRMPVVTEAAGSDLATAAITTRLDVREGPAPLDLIVPA